ncbi:sulfite exporter TauE/SafE family protein [Terrisporobacter petrolearius]|uniref:sulfite exporter TauE/SafE family protein n=1 Tax=Terrisporobacter petrolearius TaxID=1460447 RepID=UPI0031CC5D8C
MNAIQIILCALVILTLYFLYIFGKDYLKAKREDRLEKEDKFWAFAIVGLIVNFFDSLGVGSFALSTSTFKIGKMMNDKLIPGTLNVATTTSVVTEALIFMTIVKVDILTLVLMIASSMLGAYFGAGIVSKLPEKKIQLTMGTALVAVALLMLCGFLEVFPMEGKLIGLTGIKLAIGCGVCFVLGITNCVGIGMYAPIMALSFALGLSPLVAFPLMMGSTAFLQPICSVKFIKEGVYHRKASLAFSIFGVIGVLIAAYIVKSLPIDILKRVVFVVVLYTSANMFRSALKKNKSTQENKIQSNKIIESN